MTTQCQGCSRESRDAELCGGCTRTLVADLAALGWLDEQLTITRTRQSRVAAHGRRGHGDEQPLPYGALAGTAQDDLRNVIGTWARDIDPDPWRWTPTVDVLAWAIARTRLDQHRAAGELIADVRRVTDAALRAINPAEDDLAYGPCGAELPDGSECDAHLYGQPDASWVRCPRCRTQHETRERVEWMRRRMEALQLPAATLARLLPRLIDRPVSADLIRAWARAGKPITTITGADGRPQYRMGDVITVALTTPTRQRQAVA